MPFQLADQIAAEELPAAASSHKPGGGGVGGKQDFKYDEERRG